MLRKRGDMIYKTLLFRQFCVISVKVWNCLEGQILVEIFSNLSYLKTRIIHSSQIIFKVTQNLATKNVVLKWLRFCCYDYKTILFFSADVMKNHVVVSQSSTQRLRVHADGVSNQHNNVFDGNFNYMSCLKGWM